MNQRVDMIAYTSHKAIDTLKDRKWARIESNPFPEFRCHTVNIYGKDYRVKRMDYKRKRMWVLPV